MPLEDLQVRSDRRREEQKRPEAIPPESLSDVVERQCLLRPDHTVLADDQSHLTFDNVRVRAHRLASSLSRMGIERGDVISMQLPNWHETAVIAVASSILGTVLNPIVPIYRHAEVEFILRDSQSKLIFVPTTYRRHDFVSMIEDLELEGLTIITVRANVGRYLDFDHLLLGSEDLHRVDGSNASFEPSLLMYTSGTTGRAKGVVHSLESISAEIGAVSGFWSVGHADHVLMPSPISHITGLLYGIEMPLRTGAMATFMDEWDAGKAVKKIDATNVSLMIGSTPFLAELVEAATASGTNLRSLRLFGCGGTPVPPELIRRAFDLLPNCLATRIYGSTEAPTVTLGARSRGEFSIAAVSEGHVVGNEVQIRCPISGERRPDGQTGEIVGRGPELFSGYLNEEDEKGAFTSEGFFRSGDLGGFNGSILTVTRRLKDIIIRGRTDISPKQIVECSIAC